MKKIIIAVFVVLGLLVFSVPMAIATPYTVVISYGPGNGPGGEFTIDPEGFEGVLALYDPLTSTSDTFETFCLEHNEYIELPHTYDATIDDKAINGGVGGPHPDPLSIGTEWLYYQFAKATLAGYDYGSGRASSADALQDAIWMLEEEIAWNSSNVFIDLYLTTFHLTPADLVDPNDAKDMAQADGNGIYGVKALNLYETGTDNVKQSQLVYVPDASIMFLLGPAFLALGMLGRRKSKRA